MYEDWQLAESFRVESADDFLADKTPDEMAFVLKTMVPCGNCGEWLLKTDPSIKEDGICHCCSIDEPHKQRRGMSPNASENTMTLAGLVAELRELTD